MDGRVRIALVAHDKKKVDMVLFVKKYSTMLSQANLVATGTTGRVVEEATGLPVEKKQSGQLSFSGIPIQPNPTNRILLLY